MCGERDHESELSQAASNATAADIEAEADAIALRLREYFANFDRLREPSNAAPPPGERSTDDDNFHVLDV